MIGRVASERVATCLVGCSGSESEANIESAEGFGLQMPKMLIPQLFLAVSAPWKSEGICDRC